jgi:two-component system chemotaxis response regulator CheY
LQEVEAVVQKKAKKDSTTSLKMLIVDDDPGGLQTLSRMLSPYGETDIAVTGKDAVEVFQAAMNAGKPFDLICLDMLSEADGREMLTQIRTLEKAKGVHALDGVKIMMTTAAEGSQNNMGAFKSGCTGYLKKPVNETKLINLLKTLSFDKKALKNKKNKSQGGVK